MGAPPSLPEELAQLADEVRATGRPDDEARLVRLRHEAFAASAAHAPPSPWPPVLDDPFPDVVGRPPEVGPDELDAEVLGGAIQHHGCLVVRGLARRAQADELSAGIERAFAALDRHIARAPSPDDAPWFRPFPFPEGYPAGFRRRWVREGGAVWAAESPRMMARIVELYDGAGVVDAIAGYLGERPAMSVNKFTLRRVAPDAFPSWHQDGAFMGPRIRTVNSWLALTDCGADRPAPGLAIVPRRIPEVVEVGTEGAMIHNAVGPGLVERLSAEAPVIHPAFDAGDALLFDQVFLHATGTKPGQHQDRYAVEAWFFSPGDVPEDYPGLAV